MALETGDIDMLAITGLVLRKHHSDQNSGLLLQLWNGIQDQLRSTLIKRFSFPNLEDTLEDVLIYPKVAILKMNIYIYT